MSKIQRPTFHWMVQSFDCKLSIASKSSTHSASSIEARVQNLEVSQVLLSDLMIISSH